MPLRPYGHAMKPTRTTPAMQHYNPYVITRAPQVIDLENGEALLGLLKSARFDEHQPLAVFHGSERYQLIGRTILRTSALAPVTLVLVVTPEKGIAAAIPSDEPDPDACARFRFTSREAVVATLLAARRTNREISATLGISTHTARHHVQRVLEKLGVSSRREVAGMLGDACASCVPDPSSIALGKTPSPRQQGVVRGRGTVPLSLSPDIVQDCCG